MRRKTHLGVLAMVLASCNPTPVPMPTLPAGHQQGEEAAVLAAMDRYLTAISARDLQSMAQMHMPDGMSYRVITKPGGTIEVASLPLAAWVDPARAAGPALRERYWSPTVLVRGSLAVVWAPYEFWVDGTTSHCGVDVFDFVKGEGAWRVANAMWTVEPEGCEGLRPADPTVLRPAD